MRSIWPGSWPSLVIVSSGATDPPDGAIGLLEENRLFSDWLSSSGALAVVVRPDRYVYGAADNADQLNDLVGEFLRGLRRS